jgi:hypothetical protein
MALWVEGWWDNKAEVITPRLCFGYNFQKIQIKNFSAETDFYHLQPVQKLFGLQIKNPVFVFIFKNNVFCI